MNGLAGFAPDDSFRALAPIYNVTPKEIEEKIKSALGMII